MNKTERRKTLNSTPGTAHTPCVGTHVFIWPAAEMGPPEGLGCNCGMLELHYAACTCGCGQKSMSLGFTHRDLGRRAPRKTKLGK